MATAATTIAGTRICQRAQRGFEAISALPGAWAGEEERTSAAEAGSLLAAIGAGELAPFPVPPESDVGRGGGGVLWRAGRPRSEAGDDARRSRFKAEGGADSVREDSSPALRF